MPDPLPIEETPEIPMPASEGTPPPSQVPPPPPMPSVSRGSVIVTMIVFILIFAAGVLLSGYIRPLFSGLTKKTAIIPAPTIVPATPAPADPFAGWHVLTIAGLSYKLPPEVPVPACDGTPCVSQGTYLPGGTRFTVASRGQIAFVTDANGFAFINKESTVSGHAAMEFTGEFSGRTTGGYGFTRMHGYMIAVNPTQALEISHFTPTGAAADFAGDDALFTRIVSTLSFNPEIPVATTTPIPATTSGY